MQVGNDAKMRRRDRGDVTFFELVRGVQNNKQSQDAGLSSELELEEQLG